MNLPRYPFIHSHREILAPVELGTNSRVCTSVSGPHGNETGTEIQHQADVWEGEVTPIVTEKPAANKSQGVLVEDKGRPTGLLFP